MSGVIAKVALVLVLFPVARPAPQASEPESYAMVVERYADGDRAEACKELVALDARYVASEARSLAGRLQVLSDEHLRHALVKAGTLLHTDVAIGLRAGGEPAGLDDHLGLAGLYVRLADSFPSDADLRSFARRWYLAAALDRQRYLEVDGAGALLAEGLRRFPADPDLLLAMGSVEEALATSPQLGASDGSDRGSVRFAAAIEDAPARSPREQHLQQAEKEYRQALGAEPGLVEAHLRRGRVLGLLGKGPEAGVEIEWVLREGQDPALRYLALLFQGRLREGGGDLAGAAADYRAAATMAPEAQTARVALGHVLDSLGDVQGSREALEGAVGRTSLPGSVDPWWTYPYAQFSRVDSLLAELRVEARR